MLQQYFRAKAERPDTLLAMRVGDFYEFYGEDAETAARALEITLTGRDDGGTRIPMAGVPFHSVEKYLARLLAKGLKVAICDQLEDPKQAKGLVKRGVTRVLTPGTRMDDSMLSATQNSYLAALCVRDGRAGLALLDPSTGEFAVTELEGDIEDRLLQELARVRPAELLVGDPEHPYAALAQAGLGTSVTQASVPSEDRAERRLREQLRVANLEGFGVHDRPTALVAASMILAYAEATHLSLAHVDRIVPYSLDGFMRMDPATRRSLEITQNLSDGGRRYTLLEAIDETVTTMGARMLRRWLEQPLLDLDALRRRQDAVETLLKAPLARGDLRDVLRRLSDLERLVSRSAAGLAGPRDLAALRNSLKALPDLTAPLAQVGLGRVAELREQLGEHHELARKLDAAIVADPPHHLRDGGVIRAEFDPGLDALRDLSRNGKAYIASLEQAERERTGIANLKVGFNSVFGYYLEVSKANVDKVPSDYIRKQTTAAGERYITAALKEHESQVLGAEEKANALESDIFGRLRAQVAEHAPALLQTARALAELDVLAGLAEIAHFRDYVKPELTEDDVFEVRGGRHPVVELASPQFVPNDTALAPDPANGPRTVILTGPNMAGKSTYLRQNALIALLAQAGGYVPAKSCRLGLCDRIFARIGAKDELALGQSTFMVEMVESANILNNARRQSLVILDEVGRGTSTFDGLAIAWAMIEHLAELGAKTLFATHYHQLNGLADQLTGVANYRVAVDEVGDQVVWTHRVLPGGTDRSYGIHVARMAGVPSEVLTRATEILRDLENRDAAPKAMPAHTQRLQLTLFEMEDPEVVRELRGLDVNRLTPVEALKLLDDWKRKLDG